MLLYMARNQQTRPNIGELAKDSASGRIGVVMGEVGDRVQMRPVHGGKEWEAMPDDVVTPSEHEARDARETVKDGISRSGL